MLLVKDVEGIASPKKFDDEARETQKRALELRIDSGILENIPSDKDCNFIHVPLYINARPSSIPYWEIFREVVDKYDMEWGTVHGYGYWDHGANIHLIFCMEDVDYDEAYQEVFKSFEEMLYRSYDLIYPLDSVYNISEYEELRNGCPILLRDEDDDTQNWDNSYVGYQEPSFWEAGK